MPVRGRQQTVMNSPLSDKNCGSTGRGRTGGILNLETKGEPQIEESKRKARTTMGQGLAIIEPNGTV
jgi:hypothetical protein